MKRIAEVKYFARATCRNPCVGLTVGKKYKVLDVDFCEIEIRDDNDIIKWYKSRYFYENPTKDTKNENT